MQCTLLRGCPPAAGAASSFMPLRRAHCERERRARTGIEHNSHCLFIERPRSRDLCEDNGLGSRFAAHRSFRKLCKRERMSRV